MSDDKLVQSSPQIVAGVPWYLSPQVNVAIVGVVGGIVGILSAFGVKIPLTDDQVGKIALGGSGVVTGVYFIYRRWKAGKDPANPTPKLTK